MTFRSATTDAPSVSLQQVAAFRLARHHLTKRAPLASLAQVAGDMAGAQAQIMSAAQVSLWARTRGLRAEDVERALWEDRTLVKVWCMRGTVHLVPAKDFAVFVRGCTKRAERSVEWMARAGLRVDRIDPLVDATARILDRPLTREEITARLSASVGGRTHRKGGRGWGGPANAASLELGDMHVSVGWILHVACTRGVACCGPSHGNEGTFVRTDAWLPGWRELSIEEAEVELLRRYLRAYGPATVTDFAIWTYVKAVGAREIWSRLEPELAPVEVAGRNSWILRSDLRALQRGTIEGPLVRLLPFFDAFLLGHKDKGHLVDAAHYKRVYREAGWLSPVLLVDGRAGGVWSHARKGRGLAVRVEAFHPLTTAVRSAVREEADGLARFFDLPEASVTFTGARGRTRPGVRRGARRRSDSAGSR